MNSDHFKLWDESVPILKSMRFKMETKKKDGTVSIRYEQVPSIKNWIHNIKVMKELWLYLNEKHNVTSLLTRCFNQDPVENFFSSVRSHGARNTNPTCQQFESIYKTLLVNNLNSSHSLGANCEEDPNKMLQNLDCLLIENDIKEPPMSNEPMDTDLSIENLADSSSEIGDKLIISETKKYVTGFVIKKLKRNVCKSCIKCNNELCDTTPPQADEYIHSIDITRRSLYRPSRNFSNCVRNIIKIVKSMLKNDPGKSGKSQMIKLLVDQSTSFDFLTCDTHKVNLKNYIINFVIKLIIHSWCNNVNKILKGKNSDTENDSIKIQALRYYQTHKGK